MVSLNQKLKSTFCIYFLCVSLFATALLADELSPEWVGSMRSAEAALKAGDFEAAEKAYQAANQLQPHAPAAWYNQGVAAYRQQRLTEARQAFEQALATTSSEIEAKARFNLGTIDYQQALARYEENAEAAVSRLDQAIQHFREALAADRTLQAARENLELAMKLRDAWQPPPPPESEGEPQTNPDGEDQDKPSQQQNQQNQEENPSEEDDPEQNNSQQQPNQGEQPPPNQPPRQQNQPNSQEGSSDEESDPSAQEESSSNEPNEDASENPQRDPAENSEDSASEGDQDEPPPEANQPMGPPEPQPEAPQEETQENTPVNNPSGDEQESGAESEGDLVSKQAGQQTGQQLQQGPSPLPYEEAMKLLQAVRDRDLQRRLDQQELRQQQRRSWVEKDW
ncbi:Hypothetical protein PBC10988_28900 [Planctomycetales bacterium 10988]|nr:Hypothetical protein PBC10988_28900 [Planctomycetales bacterium 10988]